MPPTPIIVCINKYGGGGGGESKGGVLGKITSPSEGGDLFFYVCFFPIFSLWEGKKKFCVGCRTKKFNFKGAKTFFRVRWLPLKGYYAGP